MRISILHITRYAYGEPARYAVQALRLTPPSFDGQEVVSWSIRAPGIERASTFRDGFGNLVHLVNTGTEHTSLEIAAEGVIETSDRAGLVRGLGEAAPVRVFLRKTPATSPDAAIRTLAARVAGERDEVARLHALMAAVRTAVDYAIGETDSTTTAAEALHRGRGVCQDHAHVFIAAARVLGAPARYVNGYMVAEGEGPAEAHHGWAEAWADGVGWIGFDVANLICPTERYVRLATGLDAPSAAPIRGSRRGGPTEELDVRVEVAQQNAQQQQQRQ